MLFYLNNENKCKPSRNSIMKKTQILLVFLLFFNKNGYTSEEKNLKIKPQQDVTIKSGLSNDSLKATDFEWKLRVDNTILAIHYLGYDPEEHHTTTPKPIKKSSCLSWMFPNRLRTKQIVITEKKDK